MNESALLRVVRWQGIFRLTSDLRPLISALVAAVLALSTTSCGVRKAMYDQPKLRTLAESEFFEDGSSARALVENTIAQGFLYEDAHLYDGKVDGKPAETFPFAVTKEVLKRGQSRFNVYCTPCHGVVGAGDGMIVQRGFKVPPSYHIDRLRQAPPGYFFEVVTRGFGTMNSYAAQVKAEDRWAIIAYIRALQLSQNATIEDVPASDRASLETAGH